MPFFIPGFILLQELVKVVVVAGAAATAARTMENAPRTVYPSGPSGTSTTATYTTTEYKTVWDWWGNGLTGWQREYLLQVGYNDRGSTYALADLKRVAKYREKELLTEKSKYYIREWESSLDSSDEDDERVVNCSKKDSPVWKGMKHYRGDIKTNGESGKDRRFYRWDNTHNDIEVYNGRGEHLGSMDPRRGVIYKGPDPTNSISHLL